MMAPYLFTTYWPCCMATQKIPAPPLPPSDWHLREAHELAREHGVNPACGLPTQEVSQRSLQHGPNALQTATTRSLWSLLVDQFSDFMILVLLAAAVISGVIGDLVDTLVILVIVLLNALIGLVQAWRADQALAALQKLAAAQATVLRDGQVQQVPAHALVPGDIVLLEAGNQIPADLRLMEIAQLKVDESALTGESVTVVKHAKVLAGEVHALGDRLNMAFKGTTATHGRARGLVVATGMQTELGKVAGLLEQGGEHSTPLQRRLAAFGKRVALAVLAICAVIFVVGVLRGEPPLHMVLVAISLAVAAIPEALPAVVTVLLALGARRMVSVNALIRRLPSVETLGSVTFICSDKTGTLTQNRMQTECLLSAGAPAWVPGAARLGARRTAARRRAVQRRPARPRRPVAGRPDRDRPDRDSRLSRPGPSRAAGAMATRAGTPVRRRAQAYDHLSCQRAGRCDPYQARQAGCASPCGLHQGRAGVGCSAVLKPVARRRPGVHRPGRLAFKSRGVGHAGPARAGGGTA